MNAELEVLRKEMGKLLAVSVIPMPNDTRENYDASHGRSHIINDPLTT